MNNDATINNSSSSSSSTVVLGINIDDDDANPRILLVRAVCMVQGLSHPSRLLVLYVVCTRVASSMFAANGHWP